MSQLSTEIDVNKAMTTQDRGSDINLAVMADDHGDHIEDLLYSTESLDRKSPELWPEQIPGVTDFAVNMVTLDENESEEDGDKKQLDKEDMGMLQEFGSLTTTQLMEKVCGLQNLAYQLGLDEAREMTRGKFLNILHRPETKDQQCNK